MLLDCMAIKLSSIILNLEPDTVRNAMISETHILQLTPLKMAVIGQNAPKKKRVRQNAPGIT